MSSLEKGLIRTRRKFGVDRTRDRPSEDTCGRTHPRGKRRSIVVSCRPRRIVYRPTSRTDLHTSQESLPISHKDTQNLRRVVRSLHHQFTKVRTLAVGSSFRKGPFVTGSLTVRKHGSRTCRSPPQRTPLGPLSPSS